VGAACVAGASDAPIAIRVDSAGVELVTNAAPDRPLDVSFVREMEIGGDPSGPASFYQVYPAQVAATPDGGIAVLDRQGFQVTLFDSDGSPVVSFGREGDGPGEFRYPASIATLSDGSVSVYDYQKRALQSFTRDGAFVAQHGMTVPYNGIGMVGTPTGLLLLSQDVPRRDGDFSRRVLHLSATDTVQVGPTSPSRALSIEYTSCGVRLAQPPLFASELVWASNGRGTAIVASAAYSIAIFDGLQLVRVVRREIEPEAVTEQVLSRVLGDGERLEIAGVECIVPPAEVIEQRGHADSVPLVEALAVSPTGHLWVKRRTPGSEEGGIDVFDPSGEYLGTTSRESPFPVTFLPDGKLVTIEADSFDIERVVTYVASIGGE
jgi:hypothetical protein